MIAAVSLQNVSKTFGQGSANETVALQDIDLTIEAGEFVSLIGPSGCGKSTLLRLVGDLLLPTGGEIRVNGKGAHQARLDQDYGMVFQAPVLYEWRRVLSNVALPLELRGVKKAIREQQAQELLDMVELSGFERHYPWQLSGGMQQRAAIARALAMDPEEPQVLYNVACFYALQGMSEMAIDCLEKTIAHGDWWRGWMKNDPDLEILRNHPEFNALVNPQVSPG